MPDNLPRWYWATAGFLFLWGLAYTGLTLFSFALADADDWAELVAEGRILPEYVEYIGRIPGWVIATTAVAAATRLGGAIGLLLRRTWAAPLYAISLGCVVVIMFRGFVLANVASVIRTSQVWVEALFMALSLFAAWFAFHMKSQGRLRS